MPLGVNLTSLTKVLKCAKDDDTCTLKASDDGDILSFVYEARSTCLPFHLYPLFLLFTRTSRYLDTDRLAEYDVKLMDIDVDTLGIPETEYDARVTMPSSEFGRIVRDLSMLGELTCPPARYTNAILSGIVYRGVSTDRSVQGRDQVRVRGRGRERLRATQVNRDARRQGEEGED